MISNFKQKSASSGNKDLLSRFQKKIKDLDNKKIVLAGVFVLLFMTIGVYRLFFASALTYFSPGGTYSDWYFPARPGYQSLEWTFVPVQDPPSSLAQAGLLHYYAYNFSLVNSNGSVGTGYAGFQTNGIFNGAPEGKVINFSIWGSNGGNSSGLINPANSESGGYQIMYKYPWTPGHKYRFQLKAGPSVNDSLGNWWGLWVSDENSGAVTFIGEQRVPATINGLSSTLWSGHTSMFGEDTHWWQTLNGDVKYTSCRNFQNSAMAALNISANGNILPSSLTKSTNSGGTNTGTNGFKTTNCPVTVYSDANFNVQHNLGYWSVPASNYMAINHWWQLAGFASVRSSTAPRSANINANAGQPLWFYHDVANLGPITASYPLHVDSYHYSASGSLLAFVQTDITSTSTGKGGVYFFSDTFTIPTTATSGEKYCHAIWFNVAGGPGTGPAISPQSCATIN